MLGRCRILRVTRFTLAAFLCISPACSSSDEPTAPPSDSGPQEAPLSVFTTPQSAADLDGDRWFDHPWPSDFRKDGKFIRVDGWPNPRQSGLIRSYLDAIRGKVDGFSPAAAGYLTFAAPLDEGTLPIDAKGSLDGSSTLQLIDVDDTSPDKGKRHPIIWKFRDRIGDYYFAPNTLSWAPALGRPLRFKTRYAIVATRSVKTRAGQAFGPSTALNEVLEAKGTVGAAWKPAIDAVVVAGVAKTSIAHLSVFTTSDPVAETLAVAEHARTLPAPKLKTLTADGTNADFDQYTGEYEGSPDYQEGTPPFSSVGGGFVFDASGKPVKQRDFELRFKLAVPNATKCPAPAAGYPIVLYAHGTTGDWTSFLDDGTARALATKCLASMGVDQIFHGTRPGAPALTDPDRDSKISLAFFNLSNATAARTNSRQSAINEVARARLIATGALTVAAAVSKTGAAITFDPARIGFFGHSQGGLNGALLLAVDDQTKGGVLSGAGSAISYSLLMKVKPDPSVAGLVKVFLGVQAENEDELTVLHPALSLVQTIVDPSDPVHYYGAIAKAPFTGHVPKSVLMTEGINPDGSGDNFSPPRTIEAGAIAGAFPLLEPVVYDIPEITKLAGMPAVALPVKGNAAGGKVTVGIAQFSPPSGSDGHFVVFKVPKARTMSTEFSASLLNDAVPSITAP